MGYLTLNEDEHDCTYCTDIVEAGQGVLLKYSAAQPDEEIFQQRLTNRVGHIECVKRHGRIFEREALKQIYAN